LRGQREPIYTLARTVVPPVIRFWVRLECAGFDNVPAGGPVIVASNHISYFDPLCLGTCLDQAGRTVRFLAKAELFSNRWFGWALRGAGQIPVRRATRDAKLALEHAVRALEDGAAVVVYPEGTTTKNPDFSPQPAKSGLARLALLTGAPVVPVGQWGAHLLFAQGRIGPFRRGVRTIVRAGPPLEVPKDPNPSIDTIRSQTQRIMAAIVEQVELAKQDWSPPDWYRPRSEPVAG
jgi:1-acyl-sn-glycerol-3-phosphate acyltransferase